MQFDADEIRRLVTRDAAYRLPPGNDDLRAELAHDDDLHVIAGPMGITVLRLIDRHDAQRLRPHLDALVAEFRALAHRLAAAYQEHAGPDYEYPDQLEVDGTTWSLHVHGEHCLFTGLTNDAEVEVNTDRPDAVDPGFLLSYAKSTGRHAELLAACPQGFHDLARMLDLAGIS